MRKVWIVVLVTVLVMASIGAVFGKGSNWKDALTDKISETYQLSKMCPRHRRLGAAAQHGAGQVDIHRSRARESTADGIDARAKKTRALKKGLCIFRTPPSKKTHPGPFSFRAIMVRAVVGARQESLLHLQRNGLEASPCNRNWRRRACRALRLLAGEHLEAIDHRSARSAALSPLHAERFCHLRQ